MTRAELVARAHDLEEASRRHGRRLALWSVPLGLGQLALMRLLERRVPERAVALELLVFLVYVAGFGILLGRLVRTTRALALRCPACGARLEGLSQRIAIAAGRCDRCGAPLAED